ncbi:hypothetical protein PanWU01x14_040340, partial [Parasponia andersonii]
MKPIPPVSPRFNVGRNCSGPTKIPLSARFSGHRSALRTPFSTPPASGVLSRHRRPALSDCLSKFFSDK